MRELTVILSPNPTLLVSNVFTEVGGSMRLSVRWGVNSRVSAANPAVLAAASAIAASCHPLDPFVDSQPQNPRSPCARKRAELAEANGERSAAARELQSLNYLIAHIRRRRSEKPQRKMPVLDRNDLSRQFFRQRFLDPTASFFG
jgi:hypothetical protein